MIFTANLVNLYAETGADYIGDDSGPSLQFYNSSTGPGLQVGRLNAVSTASIDILDVPILQRSAAAAGVLVRNTVVGNQSIGVLRIQGNSVASGAAIEFTTKAFISITSTVLTTVANTDYAIVVQAGLETRYIPLFKAAALVGGAAF